MVLYVENCFHWIGYHFIQQVLDQGKHVIGRDDQCTDLKKHLAMFVARHDRFHYLESDEHINDHKDADAYVKFENEDLPDEAPNGRLTIKYGGSDDLCTKSINLPLLFGPWMPMTDDGMWRENGAWVDFTSDSFKNETVWIEEYMSCLVHCIQDRCRTVNHENRHACNCHDIHDRDSIETQQNRLKAHYQKFKPFYNEMTSL